MSEPRASTDASAHRLAAAHEALRKVQAQAAALEDLSEQLSLSAHVLEAELAGLAEQVRTAAREKVERSQAPGETAPVEPPRSTDTEGARLVALNMALEGEPREAVDRYVAEHFDLPDRRGLIDEVYAAIGG